MSHPTNSNVNFCGVYNLSFDSMKDFLKHTLSSGHQKRTRDMIMDLDETETEGPLALVPETRAKPEVEP